MRVGILGAGPAGLYSAIMIKRVNPNVQVRIIEQNAKDATFGFGVVFSDTALAFLRNDDPETADLIEPHMQTWQEIRIAHKSELICIDGIGFSAIGRLELLTLLQKRARDFGVEPIYSTRVTDLSVFDDCDFIIAADGLHSMVRYQDPHAFGEKIENLSNRFCWFGATRPFDALTQTFKQTEWGFFNAHHYRYSPQMSTFIVECDEATFHKVGFESMPEPQYRTICETIFSDTLHGANLLSNHSVWRRFPVLGNSRFYHGNQVLVGDALHTAHYSIGSGTRLAMEDVIALVKALEESDFDIAKAFPKYQSERQPYLDKFMGAALNSGRWYEQFAKHMRLEPWPFARSYLMRSGRISPSRLEAVSPQFAAQLDRQGLGFEEHELE